MPSYSDLLGPLHEVGGEGFYDWSQQPGMTPQVMRQYAGTYGYSPAQLTGIANQFVSLGSQVTPQAAADWMEMTDPYGYLGQWANQTGYQAPDFSYTGVLPGAATAPGPTTPPPGTTPPDIGGILGSTFGSVLPTPPPAGTTFDPSKYVGSFSSSTGETAFLGPNGEIYDSTGNQYGWKAGDTLYDMQGNVIGNKGEGNAWTTPGGGSGTYTPFNPPFDIPPDVFPTSQSASYSGLSPELQQRLGGYLDQLEPLLGQYRGVMDMLSSPGSFTAAYRPIQKDVNELLLKNMGQRGLISSTTAEKAFTKAAETVPQAYLSQLLGIADRFRTGAALPVTGLGMGTGTTSAAYTEDPLAPYTLMKQIIMGA